MFHEIEHLRDQGVGWKEIGSIYGIRSEAIRSKYRRWISAKPDTKRSEFGPINRTFGAVADTHLCSNFAREDALRDLYAIFQAERIDTVLHAGNMVDGYIPRINGGSVTKTSVDDQTKYVIDNYPQIDGIRTIFITGDDHEGWAQKEGFNWGGHLSLLAADRGRNDLIYAGHIEADLILQQNPSVPPAVVRLQHPGGGSAYARSYKAQKQVESYEGGEKPAILIQGHYHIANFMPERNVYVINLPGLQDQTIFGRKKMLRMEVGGAIIRTAQDPLDGHISRCSCEFIMYYNRGYHKAFLSSDDRVKSNPIII